MAKPHEDRGTMPGTRAPARTPKVLFLSLGVIGWREGSGLTVKMARVQSQQALQTIAGLERRRRPEQHERIQRRQLEHTPSVQAPLLTTEGCFQPKPNCIVINQLAIKAVADELGGPVALPGLLNMLDKSDVGGVALDNADHCMSCIPRPLSQVVNHLSRQLVMGLCALVLLMEPTLIFAKAGLHKTDEPSPSELAGKEVSNEKYPNGWTYANKERPNARYRIGETYLDELKKGQWRAYINEKIVEVTPGAVNEDRKKRTYVVDALIVKRRSYPWIFEKAGICKFDDGSELRGNFIASVNFERCRRYSTHIEKVWGWDKNLQKFATQSAKGLTCELISFGQDPETSECVDWGKCYAHFNLSRNQIPTPTQTGFCSDKFLLPQWRRSRK